MRRLGLQMLSHTETMKQHKVTILSVFVWSNLFIYLPVSSALIKIEYFRRNLLTKLALKAMAAGTFTHDS